MSKGLIDLQTDLKSLRYGSSAPYITKDIKKAPLSDKIGIQASRRIDDTSRIAQMLASKPGLKYLANEALLQQVNVGDKINKARKSGKSIAGAILSQVGGTFVNTIKIAGSTLAQVAVNGTGTHFLKGFKTDTYLQPTGGDKVSKFAAFFGAGGVEGAPLALEGKPIEGKAVSNFGYINSVSGEFVPNIALPLGYGGNVRKQYDEKLNKYIPKENGNQTSAKNGSPISVGNFIPDEKQQEIPLGDDSTYNSPSGTSLETTVTKGILTKQNLIQSIPHTGSIAGDVHPDSSTNVASASYSYGSTYIGREANSSITNAQSGAPIPVSPLGSDLKETSNTAWLQGEQDNFNDGDQNYNQNSTYTGNTTEKSVGKALKGKKIATNSGEKHSEEYLRTFSDYSTDGTHGIVVENLQDPEGKDVYPQGSTLGETSVPKIARLSKLASQINSGSVDTIAYDQENYNTTLQDFRLGSTETYSYDYNSEVVNREQRVTLGNQGRKRASYKSYMGSAAEDELMKDKLNAQPESNTTLDGASAGRDFAKFYFEIITPDGSKFLYFRAFIDSIDDSYSADWQARKYNGRAENFYTYGGFDRDISVSFNIAAASRSEMNPLYRKMVYLASATAPTYGPSGLMRGTLAKLTIGSYFSQIPGVLTSVKYSVDNNTPWEIAMGNPEAGTDDDVQELPMMLKCTISFKPIHDFAPQTGLQHYFTSPQSKYGAKPFF